MDESTKKTPRFSKRKRAILLTLPFLSLLLCLGLLNIWARSVQESTPVIEPTPARQTAVSTQTTALQPITEVTDSPEPTDNPSSIPTLASTAVPPPTATPIPLPTFPPTATITILGPPDQSRFMAEDNLVVYWSWPLPLTEDQYFGIYLQDENSESRIGRLEEANLGSGYRWQTETQYLTDGGGEVTYLIKLETILVDDPLITSEPRTLFVLSTNN